VQLPSISLPGAGLEGLGTSVLTCATVQFFQYTDIIFQMLLISRPPYHITRQNRGETGVKQQKPECRWLRIHLLSDFPQAYVEVPYTRYSLLKLVSW